MKIVKIILTAMVLSLIFVSCDSKKKDAPTDTEVEVKEDTKVVETSKALSFESKELQDYVAAYDDYMKSYAEAAEAKDMSKMGELSTRGQKLAAMSQEALKDLKGDDVKKISDYMKEKSIEMQALVQKMTAQ